MSTTTKRPPRDARHLARLAAPLEPAVAPYYVAVPPPGQLVGWYLELRAGEPTPLGANVYAPSSVVVDLVRARNGSSAAA
jgi:hypothetical protein